MIELDLRRLKFTFKSVKLTIITAADSESIDGELSEMFG